MNTETIETQEEREDRVLNAKAIARQQEKYDTWLASVIEKAGRPVPVGTYAAEGQCDVCGAHNIAFLYVRPINLGERSNSIWECPSCTQREMDRFAGERSVVRTIKAVMRRHTLLNVDGIKYATARTVEAEANA